MKWWYWLILELLIVFGVIALGITTRNFWRVVNQKDILVYHLKETSKSNASFLIKSQQEKTSKPHLLFYAFVVLDLAVLANNIFSILPIIKIPNQINWKCFILTTLTAIITPFIIIGISKLFKVLKKRLRK